MALWLRAYAAAFFAFLYLPIAVLVVLSFNKSNVIGFPLRGFTLDWYQQVMADSKFFLALANSFGVGLVSALLATVLALMAALGLRQRFRGQQFVVPAMLMPIIIPGIVSGALLLVFFGITGVPYGLWTGALVAHVTWVMPFAFLTLYPRLAAFDQSLEEAAMDLGATPWVVFHRIVLPLIRPAVIATVLFSFTLSFDEFVRTLFVIGADRTTPVYLWVLIVEQTAPFLPAAGVIIMGISVAIAALGFWVSVRSGQTSGRGAARDSP
jgi:ABC-type spermidine/putrescine transport system permease subunit II